MSANVPQPSSAAVVHALLSSQLITRYLGIVHRRERERKEIVHRRRSEGDERDRKEMRPFLLDLLPA
jgi:hypothetical protein